jgi:hypothetical protein
MFGKILQLIIKAAPGIVDLIRKLYQKDPYDPTAIGNVAKKELEELDDWKSQSEKDWAAARGED